MRYEISVSKRGDGNFKTIAEAVDSISYSEPTIIHIKNGIYREKLCIEKKDIILIGEDAEETIITFNDSAFQQHYDGRKFGTFRSYTVFLSGERIELQNLTIENSAGDGDVAGQAIALYADADKARFVNVRLLGHQDTLFLAPLPEQPRTPGSFVGPRENTPRKACFDYFEKCHIEGDIDFIFGGATAVFIDCKIYSLDRGNSVNGYITAASTPSHQKYGFIFYKCRLISNCAPHTVFLGRPWRNFASVAFLDCQMGAHIHPQGWSRWNNQTDDDRTVRFAEIGSSGEGAGSDRSLWALKLDTQETQALIQKIQELNRI
jgi:pectinesterase